MMKLQQIKIKNFRGYIDTTINFSDLSVIIGRNDVGKSTILDALDIFFNDNVKPEATDVNVYGGTKQISISCIFSVDPNKEIQIDSSDTERTSTTLKNEYLLNKDDLLEVSKIFDMEKSTIKAQIQIIAKHPNNFEKSLVTLKLADLKKLATTNNISLEHIDSRIKKEIRKEIWKNTELTFNDEFCIDTNSKESDIIILWDKIKQELPEYMIFRSDRTNTDKDKEVNDTTKAITKNVVVDISDQFEEIKQLVVNKIKDLADKTLLKLKNFDEEITNKLEPNIETKALESLFSFTFNCEDGISFNKRGSGVKRLMLLSFFLADAERNHNSSKTVIYAIEEPETSQHPDFQKMLFKALEKLSTSENRQILLTTHTPEIVRLLNRDNLIFLQKENDHFVTVQKGSEIDISKVAKTLGILPFIKNQKIIFVEGPTDVKFLMHLNDIKEFSNIINLNDFTIIPMGGSGRIEDWIKEDYLKETNVKRIYFLDRDNNYIEAPHNGIIRTAKREIENYIPKSLIEKEFKIKFSDKNNEQWDNLDITDVIYCYLAGTKSLGKEERNKQKNKIKEQLQKQSIWNEISFSEETKNEIKHWFQHIRDFDNNEEGD